MRPGGSSVLLDTCAVIWLANRAPLAQTAIAAIFLAGHSGGIFVSPISAWEIGGLSRPKAGRITLAFEPDAKTWFADFMAQTTVKEAALTPQIAIDAWYLPGQIHNDPGDRIIIATARQLGIPIVTRDRKILEYAKAGRVQVIPC